MGLGDFLEGVNDSINNFIADHNSSYATYLKNDQARLDQEHQANVAAGRDQYDNGRSFFKNFTSTTGGDMGGVDAAIRNIPGGGAVLDAPSRSWDTLFITAQHAQAAGHQNGDLNNFSWGEFTNGSVWSKAWNSWGQQGHVTAGQILASQFSDKDGVYYGDPMDSIDAQAIQNGAKDTWYGTTAAAVTDLGLSMTMPGGGALKAGMKAARAGKVIESGAEAERVAQRLATTGHEGATVDKAGDFADNLLHRPRNEDSIIGRMAQYSETHLQGIHDVGTMSDHIGPMMEDATPGARVAVADLLTQANRLEDPALRTQAHLNTFLAAQGSRTAREALIRDFPLLAKNLEEMTSNPRAVALASDLLEARTLGASDDTINGVLDRHFSRTSDAAELEALKHQVSLDAMDAKTAAEMRNSTRPGTEDRKVGEELVSDATKQAQYSADALKHKQVTADWNAAHADAAKPGLERANALLNRIMSLGESEFATGRVVPSHLDSVKTRLRLMAGDETTLTYGDANTPVIVKSLPTRAARWMLAPHARGSISLVEPDLGAKQMADAMRRSGVYSSAEVKAASEQLLTTEAAKRQIVVQQHQQDMLERIAMKHFPDADDPEAALRQAKEVTQSAIKHWGQGNEWVTKAAGEQKGTGSVAFHTPDGALAHYDDAMLQSQLADNAPFLDPEVFEKSIIAHKPGIKNNLRAGVDAFVGLNDSAIALWKHGALLRPGLAVRAALDTELRAAALMGAGGSWMQAVNGASNLLRNRTSAVSRVLLSDTNVDKAAMKRISLDMQPVEVEIGGGKKASFAFSRSAEERTANQIAMTKGADSPWKFYFTETQKHLNQFRTQRASWARFKADSPHWEASYLEYAEQLMASPTARWLAKNGDGHGDLVHELRALPEFEQEFAKVAQPKGYTRNEFANQVMHEVDTMFPDGQLADAVLGQTLTPTMVKQTFPKGQRFDIPGPERSVIDNSWRDHLRDLTGKAYKQFLDKPDMWLARNPAGTQIYRTHLQTEVDALRKGLGEGESISARDLALADKRARTKAISTVRRTFFDTTRHTAMHQQVARISPFFAAWEDAMVSWSRLIHDDPTRLAKLSGAYNAAGTLNPYLPQPLLVDNNGDPLRRGQAHDNGSYIAVPFKVGGVDYRVRLDALNSIAQGSVWWLPGFGPQATIATDQILTRFVPKDVVLDLVGTDNWLGKTVLQSMYLDGELPPNDLGTTAASVLPSWARNLYKDTLGDNFAANVQRNANFRIAEATKNGKPLNDAALKKIYDDAAKTAHNAAVIHLVAGGGLGMTGTATVDGQFYVEQMRTIQAIDPNQLKAMGFGSPEEYFAHLYPEAADLDMNLSKNETGIRASVNAEKASSRLNGVLKDHPGDIGWMVLGRENLNGSGIDDFSRTAYNMQVAEGARTKRSAQEIEDQGRAAVGWRKWQNAQAQLLAAATELGLDPNSPIIADTKRQYKALLMQNNAAFAQEVSTMERKSDYYYSQAKALSTDPRLKNRSDMVAFREYDQARQEILAETGLASLGGSSATSQAAAATLRQVGQTLAAKDYGFQQMWEKFLSKETDTATAPKQNTPPPDQGPTYQQAVMTSNG